MTESNPAVTASMNAATADADYAGLIAMRNQQKNRYFVRMCLGVGLFTGAVSLTVGAFVGLIGEEGFKMPITRTMHMSQIDPMHPGAHTRSYFSLDWLMAPSSVHSTQYTATVPGWDTSGAIRLGPQPWQQDTFCPSPNAKHDEWRSTWSSLDKGVQDKLEEAVMCATGYDQHELCARDVSGHVTYPNNAAYFVCKQSRIPHISLFENDANTWSLASSHSARVFVFFFGIILSIVAVYEALRCKYVKDKIVLQIEQIEMMAQSNVAQNKMQEMVLDKNQKLANKANRYMTILIVYELAILFFIILLRFNMPIIANFSTTKVMHEGEELWTGLHNRALPNGSFLYGIVGVLIISWRCASSLHSTALFRFMLGDRKKMLNEIQDDHSNDEKPPLDMSPVNNSHSVPSLVHHSLASTHPSSGAATPKPKEEAAFLVSDMNVSGFTSSKKIPLSAYNVNVLRIADSGSNRHVHDADMSKKLKESSLTKINNVHKLGVSTWSVLQLAVLPLWALCALSAAQGFEIDIDIQLVFLSALALAASDVFVDRLLSVVHVCEVLEPGMLHGVQNMIMLVVLCVQVVLVVFINYVSGWRLFRKEGDWAETMRQQVPDDSALLKSMNDMAIFSFNIYFAIIAACKVWKLFIDVRSSDELEMQDKNGKMNRVTATEVSWKKPHTWFGYKSLDEFKLGLLLLFVLIYGFHIVRCLNVTSNYYMSPWKLNGKHGMDEEDIQVLRWKGDWTMVHSHGVLA